MWIVLKHLFAFIKRVRNAGLRGRFLGACESSAKSAAVDGL